MSKPRTKSLSFYNHDRDTAGLTYVYPVVSRRAGGVSVGINLNPNNACNWRCIYCQVPNLKRGSAPVINEGQLLDELAWLFDEIQHRHYLVRHVAQPEHRRLVDIAFSGNGEPTTCDRFDVIVKLVLDFVETRGLIKSLSKVLITNGSMMHRSSVQAGLERLGEAQGEAWFKLDSVTQVGRFELNGTRSSVERVRRNLRNCARRCWTRIQTCAVQVDGAPPSETDRSAYLEFLREELAEGTPIADVLLYGMARPSLHPDAARVTPVSPAWLEDFAHDIRETGLPVMVRS